MHKVFLVKKSKGTYVFVFYLYFLFLYKFLNFNIQSLLNYVRNFHKDLSSLAKKVKEMINLK